MASHVSNPKGNPSSLVPGIGPGRALGQGAWEGPSEEEWEDLLAKASTERTGAKKVIKSWGICYSTFLKWRERNPDKDADFKRALRARAEGYLFDLESIADNVDDEGNAKADNAVVQGRNKLQIDFRLKYLQAFNNDFKPKQELQHSGEIANPSALTDDERLSRLAALLDTARARRDGQAPSED